MYNPKDTVLDTQYKIYIAVGKQIKFPIKLCVTSLLKIKVNMSEFVRYLKNLSKLFKYKVIVKSIIKIIFGKYG